jgi:hypothetical protein
MKGIPWRTQVSTTDKHFDSGGRFVEKVGRSGFVKKMLQIRRKLLMQLQVWDPNLSSTCLRSQRDLRPRSLSLEFPHPTATVPQE